MLNFPNVSRSYDGDGALHQLWGRNGAKWWSEAAGPASQQ